MKLKDLLGRVDKRKAEVLERSKFQDRNEAREVVGEPALKVISKRIVSALERVFRFKSSLASWSSSYPQIERVIPLPARALVTFSAAPDAGNWTLSYNGEAGTALGSGATAADVQASLRTIGSIQLATVSGSFASGFTITLGKFKSASLLTVSSSLVAATVPTTVTITDIT